MSKTPYWFRAKSVGWGWGLPRAWQGWVVLVAYVAVCLWLGLRLERGVPPEQFFVGILVATAVVLAICWAKGEPPRWR